MTSAAGQRPAVPANDDPVLQLPVRRWRRGVWEDTLDTIAAEVPVSLSYNSIPHVVMMATPRDLEDMGVGFTVSEALAGPDEIRDVRLDASSGEFELRLSVTGSRLGEMLQRRRNLTGRTGCGVCGAETIEDAIRRPPPVPAGGEISRDALVEALRALRGRQPLGQAAGSLHAAAWVNWGGELGEVREDVGRHNALDKLAGALAARGIDASGGIIAMTSRLSVDLVQKTARIGAGLLVGASTPTGLAIDWAEAAGLTLIGRARAGSFDLYTHPRRIRSA